MPRQTILTTLKDIALFPVRLAVAIFWFLNAFSAMFARKPLTSAEGPRIRTRTTRQLILYGRVIEAQKAMRSNKQQAPASVPASWELVRRTAQGDESVIATGVGHYDLAPDGSVVYTNGVKVWLIAADGTKTEVAKDSLIERVSIIG